jgi:hypothetical protein
MIRNGGPPVWLNEYHADFLVHDRLEAARRAASHRSVLDAIRRSRRPRRRRVAEVLASLGRRLRSLL